MATSSSPTVCPDTLDPQEELDHVLDLSPLLEVDEEVQDDFTLALRPEAVLLGLKIMGLADGRADPILIEGNRAVQLYLTIEDGYENDPAFDGPNGSLLPFEIYFETDATRHRNRTWAVRVRQL